jgi:CheY-like chemotaxis protein
MPLSERLILLVDDSADDVFLFKRTLAKAHLKNPVQAVANVDEAICYLEGKAAYADRSLFPVPSIVLIDLQMPEKNGFQLLTWLRDRVQFRNLHVIVVSGINRMQDVNRAYQLGASSFLIKPVNVEDLRNLTRAFPAHWT